MITNILANLTPMQWALGLGVYFLPTLFALAINYRNGRDGPLLSQLEMALFNTGLGITVVGWLALMAVIWDSWDWWNGR